LPCIVKTHPTDLMAVGSSIILPDDYSLTAHLS